MPVIALTSDSRSGGRRVPSMWRTAAAVAAAAVVMSVLTTTAAAATYGGSWRQERHTRMFLQEFPDEFEQLERTWTGADFCTWPGVVCHGGGLVDVELANMGLRGKMPEVDDDIDGSLVTVRSVDLSGNPGIYDEFEEDWKRMTALKRLDLSGTSLKGTLPREWERMASLQYLNISGTSACQSLPRWRRSQMASLSVVDFSNCNFRGTLSSDFGSLSATVTEAHFEGNNFCGCLPRSFTSGSVLATALTDAEPALGAGNCAVVNRCGDDADRCDAVATPQRNTLLFLRAFANAFTGQLRNLWTGTNYCNWHGVTCSADGTVAVDLSGFGLDGNMPELGDEIDGSKVLVTSIDLSRNPRLKDDFEADWGRLKRLRHLNLSNTGLEGSLPYAWNGMAALEVLDVHNTVACKSLPDWQLPRLRVVDLSSSSFYGSLRASWSQMTTLESVDLSGNGFCGCVPSSWSDNAALQRAVDALGGSGVAAAGCASTNRCSYAMSRCRNDNAGIGGGGNGGNSDDTLRFLREFADELSGLRSSWTGTDYCSGWMGVTCHDNGTVSVDLSGRGLYGDMPEVDDDINGANVNIVSIDLSNNPGIRDNFQSSWASLKQLEYLDLSNTGLYGNIPDAWIGMTGLREVHIHNTAACRGLPNWNAWAMSNLRVVDFSNNNMAGSLAYSWSTFTQLTSVNLAGNGFCGCVPVTWPQTLRDALGTDSAAVSASCWWLNFCSSASRRCVTVPNTGTGGGVTPAPPSSTLQFMQALNAAVSAGWSGTDYCSFSGVTCSDVDGVQMAAIDLSGRGLRASYLPAIHGDMNGARVFVTHIDLSNNPDISCPFPESWGALKQVQYLDLSATSLRGSVPDSWNGMYSLEEVHINSTLACRSLPNWRGSSLSRLRVVDLSNNVNMRGVLTSSFSSLSALTSLNIQGTNFCGCVPSSWRRNSVLANAASAAGVPTSGCLSNRCTGVSFTCPSIALPQPPPAAEDPTLRLLRRIAAALAVIFGRPRAAAAAMEGVAALSRAALPNGQTLEQNWTGDDYCNSWVGVTCDLETGNILLNLTGAGLSGELPPLDNVEGDGVALTSIDFSDNPDISGTFPATWGSLKAVRTLRLSNLGIASSLPKEWDGMTSLESLTVSNTQACGEIPAWSASGLQNLGSLDLSNNRLSGTLPAELGDFTNAELENFTLAGNSGICGCAPSSWGSAALLNGASSANSTLTSATCAESGVPCSSQGTCRAAGDGNGDGAVRTASSVVAAWVVAAFVAFAMLQ